MIQYNCQDLFLLIHIIKTSYISELTTTHLVKQDDVGMTVVTGIDTDIGHGDLLL